MALIRQDYSNGVIYFDKGEFLSGRGAGFPSTADIHNHPPAGALFWRQDFSAFYAWNRTGLAWELIDTGGGGALAISAGAASLSNGTAIFSNSNGVTFGLVGSTVTATVRTDYLTTAMASNRGSDFVQATAAFAGTSASGTIASNGISVSIGPYITTAALSNHSHGASGANGSFAFQTLSFSNANGVSFGTSAGDAITASHNALTSQSNQNVTAGNGGFAFQTLSFSNANAFSFGTSAGSAITGSYTVPTVTNSSWTVSDSATSLTISRLAFTNSNGITMTLSTAAGAATVIASHNALTSQSNQAASASNGSFAFQTVAFSNANNVTFGTSAGSIITASVAAPGAAAITQSIGISTQTAGGSTAGTSGYATGDDILYHFVPGSNITMSQSLDGASATLSIYGPAAGGGATLSGWDPMGHGYALWVTSGIGNASLYIRAVDVEAAFQYDRMVFPMHFSQATGSTLTVSNSVAWGWYSRNASTLSLYKSGSATFSINGSGTASSNENSGIRVVSLAFTDTVTAGNYYLGFVWRTSSAGNNASLSYIAVSQWASTISGYLGVASNTRMQYHPAGGVWTSTTAGPVPNSVALSDIRGNSSAFRRQPVFHFTSGAISV